MAVADPVFIPLPSRQPQAGRDSIAQGTNLSVGAPALGNDDSKNESPKGGEIPGMRKSSNEPGNLAPLGLSREFRNTIPGLAPWAIESRPLGAERRLRR